MLFEFAEAGFFAGAIFPGARDFLARTGGKFAQHLYFLLILVIYYIFN